MVLEGGVLTLMVFIFGSWFTLYTVYFESSRFGLVVEISCDLLEFVRKNTKKNTALYKTIVSCKPMDVKLAYPFYRISKDTFS